MTIVTIYTCGPYETELERLRASVPPWAVFIPVRVPDRGWAETTRAKPYVLMQARQCLPAGYWYLDADAVVVDTERLRAKTALLERSCPGIAACAFNGRPLTGTLWIGQEAGPILRDWIERVESMAGRPDQDCFPRTPVDELGSPYCWMPGVSGGPSDLSKMVIVQTQASRQFSGRDTPARLLQARNQALLELGRLEAAR